MPDKGEKMSADTNRDYIIRATAAEGEIRAFALTAADTVEEARRAHNTSPVATAALGRLMMAAVMMGVDMKGDKDLITLKINCDGPIGGLLATADSKGHVKGYVNNPEVLLPANELGKLDVGGALSGGVLNVIKDIGLKEPYVGQTMLTTGEIAEDLTYYFAASEQVPSAVALGVLMNRENTVRRAGGFIIQLLPGASDEIAQKLEDRLKHISSITSMLDEGMSPEDILRLVLEGFGPEINSRTDCSFLCNCSKERVEKALISIGKKDIEEMISDGKPVEVSCHFCGKKYEFSLTELKALYDRAK
jgi:molecular chaperone Hsp33